LLTIWVGKEIDEIETYVIAWMACGVVKGAQCSALTWIAGKTSM
jgi:hypothetical protein